MDGKKCFFEGDNFASFKNGLSGGDCTFCEEIRSLTSSELLHHSLKCHYAKRVTCTLNNKSGLCTIYVITS